MRKKLTTLALVVVLLLLAVEPALAAGSARDVRVAKKTTPPKEALRISLTGRVESKDGDTIEVFVYMTNVPFRSLRRTPQVVNTTDSKILKWESATKPRVRIPCSALAVGDKVSINGWVGSDGTIHALRIEVNKPRIRF